MTGRPYKNYILFTKSILVVVFLVILAGSIVRTTQSGMGCPDWPTCFGNIIPPTAYAQVIFRPQHSYKKGQFIIYNDSLKYAKQSFVSGNAYQPADWQQYEKHNYAKFEVYQTWIEYINRLCTGVLGILILIHLVWSYRLFYATRKSIVALSFGILLLTVFEAWLGKVLVDSNLAVLKITLHMFPVLLIAAIPVIILQQLAAEEKLPNRLLKNAAVAALLLLLVQLFTGTEVRAQVDTIAKSLNYDARELWIASLDSVFVFHQVFSFVIAVLCLFLGWRSFSYASLQRSGLRLMVLVLATAALGFIMAYLHIPAAAQPLHLLLSSLLVLQLFAFRLQLK